MTVTEDTVEQAAIEWFQELGYAYLAGPSIAPGEAGAERDSYGDVVLQSWLAHAIDRLNPKIPASAREDALRKVLRVEGASLVLLVVWLFLGSLRAVVAVAAVIPVATTAVVISK
jgi:type I restriction enzyme R subunit